MISGRGRPINVLHVNDKLSMDGVNPSSCTFLFSEWIEHIDPSQFHFSVCTLRKPDPAGEFLETKSIRVYYLGFGKYSYKNIKGIMDLIEKEKADIVHLHGYGAANYGRIAAHKKGVINIVHEHAVLKVLPHQYLADFLLRNYTDAAVAVSGNVKDFMIRGRHIPAAKISVIGNGIRLEKYVRSDETVVQMNRANLGIPEGTRVIGAITRLREEKGNEYLIRSVPHILKELSNVIILIVGEGPLRKSLEKLAVDLNILQYVKFLGFRTDVAEMLSLFDVNVIPSLTEGFPLSLVEAMSLGNAIVTTNVGGMRELAKDMDNVLFVKPRDPIDIGEKVSFLLNNPGFAEKLSKRAREESLKFSVESSANRLSKLYMDLLGIGHS